MQNLIRRKSFHLFPSDQEPITQSDIEEIYAYYKQCKPLYPNIKTSIRILPSKEISFKTRQQYNVLFYSEKKEGYLENIGYLGQQLDLFLVSKNIGTLWFGLARCDIKKYQELDYCIMIAISKVDPSNFRTDLSQFRRKPLETFWKGSTIPGVTEFVQTAPSSVNSQPWLVEHLNNTILVKRIQNPILSYFNKIDIGIFLFYMDFCLKHNGLKYAVEYETENVVAKYIIDRINKES